MAKLGPFGTLASGHLPEQVLGEDPAVPGLLLWHPDRDALGTDHPGQPRKAVLAALFGVKAMGLQGRDQHTRQRRVRDVGDRFQAQAAFRSTIIFLISAIALAGLRPLGQVLLQFMMVWHR